MSGKQAKKKRRELAEMSAIARDLNHAVQSHMLVGGVEVKPAPLQTQFGPITGVMMNFMMQDGKEQGPFIMEPMSVMVAATHMLAAIANIPMVNMEEFTPELVPEDGALVGDGAEVPPTPDVESEVRTSSGLILPPSGA